MHRNSDRLINHRSCRFDKKNRGCNLATNRYRHILNEIDYFIREEIADPDTFTAELNWTDDLVSDFCVGIDFKNSTTQCEYFAIKFGRIQFSQ